MNTNSKNTNSNGYTNANKYRIDRVKRLHLSNDYRIPAGMSSIVYLDSQPPSPRFRVSGFNNIKEVLIYSVWSETKCSFVIDRIV